MTAMQHDIYIYLLLMSVVTLAIRIVPLTLIRGQIKNSFLRSVTLFYVPYVTLAVMTFPAITEATQTPVSGALASFSASASPGTARASSRSPRPAASSSSSPGARARRLSHLHA